MSVTCPRDLPSASPQPAVSLPQHLVWIVTTVLAMGLLDVFVMKYLCRKWFGTADKKSPEAKDKATKARWFVLHSIANACIVVFGLPDCVTCLQYPACAMVEPFSYVPSYLAFGIHLYHFIGFSDLRAADVVHHLVFPLPMGIADFTMHWGPIVNFLLFFMSGLPGAIDYALLALVKLSKFDRLEEKRINAHINIWLRGPGLVVVATTIWTCIMHGKTDIHTVIVIVIGILTFGNGVYYGQQVVRNYEEERGLQITREQARKELRTPHHYPLPDVLLEPPTPLILNSAKDRGTGMN